MRRRAVKEDRGGIHEMKITYYKVNLYEIATKLGAFFQDRPNILIAVIFGSATRREEVRDLDIAVYFRENPDIMEICGLASEVEDLVRMSVDIVPLDEVPPKLLAKMLFKGVVVKIADRRLLTRLMKTPSIRDNGYGVEA